MVLMNSIIGKQLVKNGISMVCARLRQYNNVVLKNVCAQIIKFKFTQTITVD